jgi:hypothetical protein
VSSSSRLGEVGFFLRADTNLDKQRDISDRDRTLQVLFSGEDSLPCDDAADANDDGKVDLSDPVFTLLWLYLSGRAPPSPPSGGPIPRTTSLLRGDGRLLLS